MVGTVHEAASDNRWPERGVLAGAAVPSGTGAALPRLWRPPFSSDGLLPPVPFRGERLGRGCAYRHHRDLVRFSPGLFRWLASAVCGDPGTARLWRAALLEPH